MSPLAPNPGGPNSGAPSPQALSLERLGFADPILSAPSSEGPSSARRRAILSTTSKTSMRPTLRLACLMGATIPLATLLAAVLGARWPFALIPTLMCLVLMFADLSMTPPGPLKIELALGDSTPLGKPFFASLSIAPPSEFHKAVSVEAELEMEGPADNQAESRASGKFAKRGPESEASHPNSLDQNPLGQKPLVLDIPISPRRRGRLRITRVWLRWKGPFGLCQIRQTTSLDFNLAVLQDIGGIHQAALQFFHREADIGQKTQPFKGEGSEFDSLMDYSVGMDNRLIDWKHSARHHKLLAKEFRLERNHQIVLCFDTGRLLTEPVNGVPKLDHFIRAGMILAWVSLMSGDMVGACGFDLVFRSFIKPAHGRNYFARIQRFASELDYRSEETNFTVGLTELKGRRPHRSLVIVFTECIDAVAAEFLTEGLALLSKKHIVIFVTTPDPLLSQLRDAWPGTIQDLASSVIAESFQRDRSIVLQKAARQGVHCVDAPPGAISTAILNRYLMIKQRGLL